jgi:Holliday junction DNA helicase RuvA
MISYLKGTIQQIDVDSATILINNNIGYQVFMTESDLAQLAKNQAAELFCYHHITDRSQELYGFLNLDQRRFFKLLIDNVSGVGPKSALKILAKVDFKAIKSALGAGQINQLEVLGLTKKTAEKIMLGLKNKIADSDPEYSGLTFKPLSIQHQEALTGLINLGYKKSEAQTAISQINVTDKTTEQIIKQALRQL